jgi:hypothetical protein
VYEYNGTFTVYPSRGIRDLFVDVGSIFAKLSCKSTNSITAQPRIISCDGFEIVVDYRLIAKAALSNVQVTVYADVECIVI